MTPLRRALIAALACAPSCGGPDRARLPPNAPNVLLISIDTLRADRLGFYGCPKPTSPFLDAFAAGAVVFEHAEGSAPWTLASLASVMTSEVVSTHNCWGYDAVLGDSFHTLPEILLAAGYDTACVVSHLYTTSRHGLQQGFVHTDDSYAYPEIDPARNITSQVISDKGIRFLDQKKGSPDEEPWFLWLHYFDPHREYMEHAGISEEFVTPGQRPQHVILNDIYEGEIRYTDLHVGRVLERLDALHFAQNTIVVLLADHGEEFLDHGALGHGNTLYEEMLHVPLVVRAPGIAPRRVTDLARQIDVLPTVLDLVGLPLPPAIAGRSLVPALGGRSMASIGALAEMKKSDHAKDSWRTDRYRLIRETPSGKVQLFDVTADPREQEDIAGQHEQVVESLLKELDDAKQAGRERAKLFGLTPELTNTPGVLKDLEALGYVGGDEEPPLEAPRRGEGADDPKNPGSEAPR